MKAIALLALLPALVACQSAQATVTLFTDENYGGESARYTVTTGFCSGVDMFINDATTSLTVEGNNIKCYFYDSANCPDVVTEGAIIVYTGGCPNLNTFNDKVSSFVCLQYASGDGPDQGGVTFCNGPPSRKRSVPRRGLAEA